MHPVGLWTAIHTSHSTCNSRNYLRHAGARKWWCAEHSAAGKCTVVWNAEHNVVRIRVCNIFARTLSSTVVVDDTIEAPSLYSLLCETQNDRPLHFCYIDILALQKGNVRMRSLTYWLIECLFHKIARTFTWRYIKYPTARNVTIINGFCQSCFSLNYSRAYCTSLSQK